MKTSALKMKKPLNAVDIFYLPKMPKFCPFFKVINNPKGI